MFHLAQAMGMWQVDISVSEVRAGGCHGGAVGAAQCQVLVLQLPYLGLQVGDTLHIVHITRCLLGL